MLATRTSLLVLLASASVLLVSSLPDFQNFLISVHTSRNEGTRVYPEAHCIALDSKSDDITNTIRHEAMLLNRREV